MTAEARKKGLHMKTVRLAAGCFLLSLVLLGAAGIRDTNSRKCPLAAYLAILVFSAIHRKSSA